MYQTEFCANIQYKIKGILKYIHLNSEKKKNEEKKKIEFHLQSCDNYSFTAFISFDLYGLHLGNMKHLNLKR